MYICKLKKKNRGKETKIKKKSSDRGWRILRSWPDIYACTSVHTRILNQEVKIISRNVVQEVVKTS